MSPERAWDLAPRLMPNGLLPDVGARRLVRVVIAQTLMGFQETDSALRAEFRRLDDDLRRGAAPSPDPLKGTQK